jgi:AcrR family transcriptional regulator
MTAKAGRNGRRGRPPRDDGAGAGRVDTRLAIQDAAERLFAEHGFDAVTVRQVAASAGVDPALLHRQRQARLRPRPIYRGARGTFV